jgi:protoporphyrin/coproporphyrin ferrochelatase
VNLRSHGAPDDAGRTYDALLYLSFGGPEGPDEVMPFLERVTAGRGVPRERLEEVAEHYLMFGGVSPINAQNRAVVDALRAELARSGPEIPVYWGNRNAPPLVEDVVAQMKADGVRRAAAFVTSAWSSYSGCRQYREDIARAQEAAGHGAPKIDKLRQFFNHAGFIEPQAEKVAAALEAVPAPRRGEVRLLFTAHSIPVAMAETSSYVQQMEEASRLAASLGAPGLAWDVAWQSRSGPPEVPWLEPDVGEHIEKLAAEGVTDVVVVPIGFVSDHLEVKFDLDVEAARTAAECGVNMVRAETVGAHPRYVRMIRDLLVERMTPNPQRAFLGDWGAMHDICAADCCPAPQRGPA